MKLFSAEQIKQWDEATIKARDFCSKCNQPKSDDCSICNGTGSFRS